MERFLIRTLEYGLTLTLKAVAALLRILHYVTATLFYAAAIGGAYLLLKTIAEAMNSFLQAPIGIKPHSSDWTWMICAAATGIAWVVYRFVKGLRGEWGLLRAHIMALPPAFAPPAVISDQREMR